MSDRDYFAAKALSALRAQIDELVSLNDRGFRSEVAERAMNISQVCYVVADAMVAQRAIRSTTQIDVLKKMAADLEDAGSMGKTL